MKELIEVPELFDLYNEDEDGRVLQGTIEEFNDCCYGFLCSDPLDILVSAGLGHLEMIAEYENGFLHGMPWIKCSEEYAQQIQELIRLRASGERGEWYEFEDE